MIVHHDKNISDRTWQLNYFRTCVCFYYIHTSVKNKIKWGTDFFEVRKKSKVYEVWVCLPEFPWVFIHPKDDKNLITSYHYSEYVDYIIMVTTYTYYIYVYTIYVSYHWSIVNLRFFHTSVIDIWEYVSVIINNKLFWWKVIWLHEMDSGRLLKSNFSKNFGSKYFTRVTGPGRFKLHAFKYGKILHRTLSLIAY